jgi:DNA repair protein RecO (recombination protein O)
MGERVDNAPAYILHSHPYLETSLIVEALSREHGRVSLVARGARRPASALKSRLIAFQPLWLSWFGKNSLRTLHAAEWQGGDLRLGGQALMCGFYLNELLLKLLPQDDAHENLYDTYADTLGALASGPDPEPILRRFELALLTELGYAQTLDQCADGTAVRAGARYAYIPGEGPRPAGAEPGYGGGTLLDMARGEFSAPGTAVESKRLMRMLINHYLGDKPLMTRRLLVDLQDL